MGWKEMLSAWLLGRIRKRERTYQSSGRTILLSSFTGRLNGSLVLSPLFLPSFSFLCPSTRIKILNGGWWKENGKGKEIALFWPRSYHQQMEKEKVKTHLLLISLVTLAITFS